MSREIYPAQLNALLDAELPPDDVARLMAHLVTCPACAKDLAALAALRAALQQDYAETDGAAEFQARIAGLLEDENSPATVIPFRPRPVFRRAALLAAGFAVAAMLMIALLPRHSEIPDLMSVRDAALRSGLPAAVLANNAGPAVAGFRLAAARPDIVAGHPARVLDYVNGDKTITLCIWPANGEPAHGVREAVYKGMAISYWNDGHEEYWAASRGAGGILDGFVAAFRANDS